MENEELTYSNKISDIIGRIFNWSEDRGLNSISTPLDQNLKLKEEVGELARAIQKQDVLGVMDGLGDSVVVVCVAVTQLPNYNDLNKPYNLLTLPNLKDVFDFDKVGIKQEFSRYCAECERAIQYAIQSCQQNENGTYAYHQLDQLLKRAYILSAHLNIDLLSSLKMAYSTIHFRDGRVIDGVYVKRTPDVAIVLPTKILTEDIDTIINSVKIYAENNGFELFKIEFDLKAGYIYHK